MDLTNAIQTLRIRTKRKTGRYDGVVKIEILPLKIAQVF